MHALILAGGLGTRLRSIFQDRPKPMADIAGRPFLEYLLDYWILQGINQFTISVGYLGSIIQTHIGNSYRGIDINYMVESSPLGTGGAIRAALINTISKDNNLVILNGDTWFEANLDSLRQVFFTTSMPLTICCATVNSNTRYGGLKLGENNKVINFGVQIEQKAYINGGCYLIHQETLKNYISRYPDSFSFEKDVIPNLVSEEKVSASIQNGVFIDIGIPEDYSLSQKIIPNRLKKLQN